MHVFVYGTLRRGERNHDYLKGASCVAEQAGTAGKMFQTAFDYPVLLEDDTALAWGELYEIDEVILRELDELEGYQENRKGNLFQRVRQRVLTDKGIFSAFVYVGGIQAAPMQKKIKCNDWKVHHYIQKEKLYYFAYGSCMDNQRFKVQNVDHLFKRTEGGGKLEGYTLRYSLVLEDGGRADVVEEGGAAEGKLYIINQSALAYLFKREGVYHGEYRPTIVAIEKDNGTSISALTFTVIEKQKEAVPPGHYIEEILRGAQGYCSESYVEKIKSHYQSLLSAPL